MRQCSVGLAIQPNATVPQLGSLNPFGRTTNFCDCPHKIASAFNHFNLPFQLTANRQYAAKEEDSRAQGGEHLSGTSNSRG
jgi:hypothetical protein